MKMVPLGETIFVLPDKAPEQSKSGIILPGYSQKRPTSGTIIAVGKKANHFQVGLRVVYGEYSGAKQIIEYGGQDTEIFLMQPSDILALLEE